MTGAALTAVLPSPAQPSIGENGRIAFVWIEEEQRPFRQIFAVDQEGRRRTQLTFNDVNVVEPAWSPDGRHIAYAQDDGGIVVMDADGSNQHLVTTPPGLSYSPTWSPDGARLAFHVYLPEEADLDIYLVDPDGTGLEPFLAGPTVDSDPAWSPDGARMAFARERGNGQRQIYVVNLDGTGLRRLTRVWGQTPAWSPDGTKIAFERYIWHEGNPTVSIFVMDADGTNKTRLTPGPIDVHPAWSPDGTRILFERSVPPWDTYFVAIEADGTGETVIGEGGEEPDWQPVCSIRGTPGDDTLVGTPGRDLICGFGGDDVILGGGGRDVIFGGPGDDRLYGGGNKDVVVGRSGADLLFGGPGGDLLTTLDGTHGNDEARGGTGRDSCLADPGDRTFGCA